MSEAEELGTRERKRRETRQRIIETALKLFATQGYEAATVDAIAGASGISRRTFFHYFKTKDEILTSMEAGLGEQLVNGLSAQPAGNSPWATMRGAMVEIASAYPLEQLVAIDRIMISSEAVQSRKQASYVRDEAMLFTSLRQRWPQENPMVLRLVAFLSIGITRLTLDAWRAEGGKRPIVALVQEAFDALGTIEL